jgi:UDP-N-acetylmuramoyl-L-alanyl-D-glutamate--2,6-diaminopimelate ligase
VALTLGEFAALLPAGSGDYFPIPAAALNLEVHGLAQSSRQVHPGYLFCALAGERTSGLNYAAEAVAAGAIGVLVESSLIRGDSLPLENLGAPVFVVDNLRNRLGHLASEVYQTAASGIKLFGVTGTNGKTSTASYLQRLLQATGVACGLSASTERIVGGSRSAANLTTPEVCELHDLIWQMRQADTAAAIEVSAQALVRQRVDGLIFEVAGFTNLSRDHLDDFGSMEDYFAAKLELFNPARARRAVVFVGDEYARSLASQAQIPVTTVGAGADWDYLFADATIRLTHLGQGFELAWPASELMARNFALAFVMLVTAGFDAAQLSSAASRVDPGVAGRLERVASGRVDGFVDYAHTPHAIESALGALSHYHWVTIIFGASGNRDAGKRPAMAEAAAKANFTVVTDQHPRDEDPSKIRQTLTSTLAALGVEFADQEDPRFAVREALANTPPGGAVLWCGPGQLTYREVRGEKKPFSAAEILREAIEND